MPRIALVQQKAEAPAFSAVGEWGVSDLPSRLQALARDVSPEIAFLDLTPSLVSAASDGELVYFLDDTHWTPAGHRVAADAIWRFLSDQDWDTTGDVYEPIRKTSDGPL